MRKRPYKKKKRFKRVRFDLVRLKDWAKAVKKRDGFSCRACGYRGYLHSHHLVSKTYVPKHAYDVWNGITLCVICHMRKSGVHGTHAPRNKTVELLRKIYKNKDISAAKDVLNKISTKNNIVRNNNKKIKYTPYKKSSKKNFKRKLY